MTAPVIIVHLRRPRADDPRTDPLYEFGSFGLTGCHRTNLLADRDAAGCRLAFAQGGDLGFRLVMLTPPVDVRGLAYVREAFWTPAEMPLRYDTAPILIDNTGNSDVDGLREMLDGVNRSTPEGQFSSSFRTRKQPLEPTVAAGIVRAWNRALEAEAPRAEAYWEALPYWDDGVVERDRHARYQELARSARGEAPPVDEEDDDDIEDHELPADATRARCRPRDAKSSEPKDTSRRRC